MEFDLGQLAALRAAVDEGTLDGAARRLHVTPSAISQRIRALEKAAGRVLLVRSKPVRVTDAGATVLRLARAVDLLNAETARELDPSRDRITVSVAVNADSLATWFLPAIAPLRGRFVLELRRADEAETEALLRDGTVMAAVTTSSTPVPGCAVTPLGTMRYRAVAAADFIDAHLPDGCTPAALATAPVVAFDHDDRLQHAWLRASGCDAEPTAHRVPSTEGFTQALVAGLGWGLQSDLQLERSPTHRPLIDLDPSTTVDVALHWQHWRIQSPVLDELTTAVVNAARRELHPGAAATNGD